MSNSLSCWIKNQQNYLLRGQKLHFISFHYQCYNQTLPKMFRNIPSLEFSFKVICSLRGVSKVYQSLLF